MLTDIHALADHFLIVLPNINSSLRVAAGRAAAAGGAGPRKGDGGRKGVRSARGCAGNEASARREVRDGPDTWGPPARERERGREEGRGEGVAGWAGKGRERRFSFFYFSNLFV